MAIFVPKKIKIDGVDIQFVQSSLSVVPGYGETKVRVQVSGKNVEPVSSQDLDTAIGQVSFDMVVSDTGSSTDIRNLVKAWKSNSGRITIFIEPDGVGVAQNFTNMSLTNNIEISESPDGNMPLVFMGRIVQLT